MKIIREELSSVLKGYKKDSGLTYKEISEEVGINITSVRYAMNGGDNVGLEVFQKLYEFFDVPYFIGTNNS